MTSVTRKDGSDERRGILWMKRWALLLLLFTVGCVEPEAGYVKVILDDRVEEPKVVTRFTYYNPLHQEVFVYSTAPIDIVWPLYNEDEEKTGFTFLSKDIISVSSGVEFQVQMAPEGIPMLVRETGISQDRYIRAYLRIYIDGAIRSEIHNVGINDFLEGGMVDFQDRVQESLNARLEDRGVVVQEFHLAGGLEVPKEIQDAVKARLLAEQRTRQAEAQIAAEVARAETAEIVSQKEMDTARKWAEINRELSESLTPELLQYLMLRSEQVLNPTCPAVP